MYLGVGTSTPPRCNCIYTLVHENNVIIKSMKKLVQNSALLVIGQVINRAIGFFYFIFLARTLSVKNFGIYAWVLGFMYNLLPLADFGLHRYVLKHVPRKKRHVKEYFRKLLGLKLALAVVTVIICAGTGFLLGIEGNKLLSLLVCSLVFLPHNFLHLVTAFQNAQETVVPGIIANFIFSSLAALLGFFVTQQQLSVPWLFVAYLVGVICGGIFLLFKAKQAGLSIQPILDRSFAKAVFSESWVFAVLVIANNFYLRIPLMTIERMLGDYQAGIYGSISKFIEAGVLIPQAVLIAAAPTFSRLLVNNKEKLKKLYQKSLLAVFFLALPVTAIFNFAGDFFIKTIYDAKYLSAVPALGILGLVMPLLFVNWLAANIIENSPRVKSFLPWGIGHFLLVFILSYFFVRRWAIIGGAASLLVGELIRLLLNNVFVARSLNQEDSVSERM